MSRLTDATSKYLYRDLNGTVLGIKGRFPHREGGKRFEWFRPDGTSSNGEGAPQVPYRMPEIAAGDVVWVVEGERDADILDLFGVAATTSPHGAQSGWLKDGEPRFDLSVFAGKRVVVLPDQDEPGQRYADSACLALFGVASEIRVIGVPTGNDAADYLRGGGDIGVLEALASSAPAWQPDPANGPWTPADLASVDLTNPVCPTRLLREDGEPILYRSRWNVVHGQPEAAKTWLAQVAVAQEVRARRRCVFLDYEDSEETFMERLVTYLDVDRQSIVDLVDYFSVDARLPEDGLPILLRRSLARANGLVVLDSALSSATVEGHSLIDNEGAGAWRWSVLELIAKAAHDDAALLLIDHDPIAVGKNRPQAMGAQAKHAGIKGVQIRATVHENPAPGREGRVSLHVTKDRLGKVRSISQDADLVGTFVMTPNDDGTIDARIIEPSEALTGTENAPRDDLVVALRRVFADAGEMGLSKTGFREKARAKVKAGQARIDETVDWMILDGEVERFPVGKRERYRQATGDDE